MSDGGAGLGRGVLSFGLARSFALGGNSAGPAGPAGLPRFVGSLGKSLKGGVPLYGGVFDLSRALCPVDATGGGGFTVMPGGRGKLPLCAFFPMSGGGAFVGGVALCLGSLVIVGEYGASDLAGGGLRLQSIGLSCIAALSERVVWAGSVS